MNDLIEIISEIFFDVLHNIGYFVKNNLMNIANVLNLLIPFLMFFVGQDVGIREGKISIAPEIIILVFCLILVFYLKAIANKTGKGLTIPIPKKRFTEVDDDGEVSIEHARLQELLLYVADLEDWLERKGINK